MFALPIKRRQVHGIDSKSLFRTQRFQRRRKMHSSLSDGTIRSLDASSDPRLPTLRRVAEAGPGVSARVAQLLLDAEQLVVPTNH